MKEASSSPHLGHAKFYFLLALDRQRNSALHDEVDVGATLSWPVKQLQRTN